MKNIINSRRKCWSSDEDVSYEFPGNWDIKVFSHESENNLDQEEVFNRIQNPIGCHPLSLQLKPGMKVTIISDDISRPTRTDLIIPVVLKILNNIGISMKDVSIVIASGTHARMSNKEKVLKFGSSVNRDIKIIDHNYRKGNVYIGRTSFGTPMYINRYLTESDFLIGVGGIYSSSPAGFGGGAKLILGVCGEETIKNFHFKRNGVKKGGSVSNEFRNDLLEAARLAKMNFIINNLISKDRDIIEIFAGDVQDAFISGANRAKDIYGVSSPNKYPFDLVISDVYPFDSSFTFTRKGNWPVSTCDEQCYRLVISAIHGGLGYHGLFPVKVNRLQKLLRSYKKYKELKTKELIKKVILKTRNKFKPVNLKKADSVNTYRSPVNFIHNLPDNPPFIQSGISFTNSLEDFIKIVQDSTKNRDLKVGFYQASSLTFPK